MQRCFTASLPLTEARHGVIPIQCLRIHEIRNAYIAIHASAIPPSSHQTPLARRSATPNIDTRLFSSPPHTIYCADNTFQLRWSLSFPHHIHKNGAWAVANSPTCYYWTHSKAAPFGVPSARSIGSVTNPGFVAGYDVFEVGTGAVGVDTYRRRQ